MELIVTIAILVILMTIIAPSLSGFASTARDQVSDANLELLNFATRSYASFHEIENEDVFKTVTGTDQQSDQQRQQVLVSDGLIDQAVTPSGEDGYCWNVTDQKWIRYYSDQRTGCGGTYTPEENEDGSLHPDPIVTPEPTVYPSANPQPTALPTNAQTACVASQGTYDRLNKTCSCPSGMVLEGIAEIEGSKYPVCISVEEYMCAQSGGRFENNACLCPDGYEYKDETRMCAVIPVSDQEQCENLGGKWDNENKKCELGQSDVGFDYDSDNPNFIYAAHALGGTGDHLFDVFKNIQSFEEIQKSGGEIKLPINSYFYHNNQVYRVGVSGVVTTENESFEEFYEKYTKRNAGMIFNISLADIQVGLGYPNGAFVKVGSDWYQALCDTRSNPTAGYGDWIKCGPSISEFSKAGCSLEPKAE